MAQHLLFQITYVDDGVNYDADDIIDMYWDDVTEEIVYQLNSIVETSLDFISENDVIRVQGGSLRGTLGQYSRYQFCDDTTLSKFYILAPDPTCDFPFVTKVDDENSPLCCTALDPNDFQIIVSHQSILTPANGQIQVKSSSLDITQYQAQVNGGAWTSASGGAITFATLAAGTYSLVVRRIGSSCIFTAQVIIENVIGLAPFQFEMLTKPDQFMPAFYPISYTYKFLDNSWALTAGTAGKSRIATTAAIYGTWWAGQKYIRIVSSGAYNGIWKITNTTVVGATRYIYFDAPYVGAMTIRAVPNAKVNFDLYCELGNTLSNFTKLATVSCVCDDDGLYTIRIEGFLQSAFDLKAPIWNAEEITLSRKYYLVPKVVTVVDGDIGGINTAVYSAIEDLTPYLESLLPLGPAPLSFINEETLKGMPVLFSLLDQDKGRVVNIVSDATDEIVSTSPVVVMSLLPGANQALRWIGSSVISDLNVDPALPDWITIEAGPNNEVNLNITTYDLDQPGDYLPEDYENEDYLTFGFNAIVGCYEYVFKDGVTELFTLQICVYPVQQLNSVCPENAINIAWINREGGWSSYIFGKGRKVVGYQIESTTEFKRELELKKSSVEGVYQNMEVNYVTLNPRELFFIASMRFAIQAYLFNEATNTWDIPIYIEKANFPVLTKPFKQAEVIGSFRFRYSEELKVQRQ